MRTRNRIEQQIRSIFSNIAEQQRHRPPYSIHSNADGSSVRFEAIDGYYFPKQLIQAIHESELKTLTRTRAYELTFDGKLSTLLSKKVRAIEIFYTLDD